MFKKYVSLGLGILCLAACSDETTIYEDPLLDHLSVENNSSVLESYVSFEDAGVVQIFEPISIGAKSGRANKAQEAGDYPLTVVAGIKPPVYNNVEILTSTHVQVDGTLAYVSYNTAGEVYRGAIDIIDIANPAQPRLRSRLIFTNADINVVQHKDGYVYFAGGVDKELSSIATSSAFFGKIPTSGARFDLSMPPQYVFQEGDTATDILIDGPRIWVTTGTQGYLASYSMADLTMINQVAFTDLRSVAVNNGLVAVLNAGDGINILDANLNIIRTILISTNLGANTKRTIDFRYDRLIVSEANKGSGVYDYTTGTLLKYIDIPVNPEFVLTGDKVTNAAAFNEDLILMANGGAGLSLAEMAADGSIEVVGVMELSDLGGSVNHVGTKNDYLIAASGKDGIQIIKFNRPSESLLARCTDLPPYEGSAKFYVREGEIRAYSGSKNFNLIENEGALLLCGSWTVRNDVKILKNALFELNGNLAVGRNKRKKDIIVEEGATFVVEGNLTVYGKLTLKRGATLQFLGSSNVVDVHEKVEIEENVTITGTFEDVRNQF